MLASQNPIKGQCIEPSQCPTFIIFLYFFGCMSQLEKMQPTLKYDWFKTVLQIDVSVEHEMFFALKEDKIFT